MDAVARLRGTQLPAWRLSVCAASVVVAAAPGLQELLIYDRAAVASGELWRLITGNLVHLSTEHLFYDLTVFFMAGWMIEVCRIRHFPRLCLLSAVLIGIAIYLFIPEMLYYGGLSGVATAAVAFLCLDGLYKGGIWRWLCMAALIGLIVKLGLEVMGGRFLILEIEAPHIAPAPISHAIGITTALFLFALNHRIGLRRSLSGSPHRDDRRSRQGQVRGKVASDCGRPETRDAERRTVPFRKGQRLGAMARQGASNNKRRRSRTV